MRPWRKGQHLRLLPQRSLHDSFFELYGRELLDTDNGRKGTNLASTSNGKTFARPKFTTNALALYFDEQYACPSQVSTETRVAALQSIRGATLPHKDLGLHNYKDLWKTALLIHNHGNDINTWQETWFCCFSLFRQGLFELSVATAERKFNSIGDTSHCLSESDFSAALRLLSIFLLGVLKCREVLHLTYGEKKLIRIASTSLEEFKRNKNFSGAECRDMVLALELLMWSLDWIFQKGFSNFPGSDAYLLKNLLDSIPKHLKRFPLCSSLGDKDFERFREVSPWALHQKIVDKETTHSSLWEIFSLARKWEKDNEDMVIFGLAQAAGVELLQNHFRSGKLSSTVLDYLGTSLRADLIAKCGKSEGAYQRAATLLSQMSGSEAYQAMRKLLFHRTAQEQREMQERYGDLLFPGSIIGSNWQEALSFLQQNLGSLNPSWRHHMSDVLRLLSDAGKCSLYYKLLSDYQMEGGEQHNLSVASSLAQVIRRSGKWWHANSVVELIANSAIPQSDVEEGFLSDACLQVMHAFRTARRWKDALSFFTSLHTVMPAQGHRWMCSVLTELPPEAPWEEALSLVQSKVEVPIRYIECLQAVHASGLLPTESRSRRHTIRSLVHHGNWRRLLEAMKIYPDDISCSVILQAARQSPHVVPHDFFNHFPDTVFINEEVAHLGFIVAQENGLIAQFLSAIHRHNSSSSDWAKVGECCILGRVPSGAERLQLSCPGAIRKMMEMVCADRFSIDYSTTSSQSTIAELCGVPLTCVKKHRKGNVVSLKSVNPASVGPELVLYADDNILLLHKPYGVDTLSLATGAARITCARFLSLPLVIPSSCTGVVFLVSPLLATKYVLVRLTIIAHLVLETPDSFTPILASSFSTQYNMRVLHVTSSDNRHVKVRFECVSPLSTIRESLDSMKRNVYAEGWAFEKISEGVTDEVGTFIINSIRVTYFKNNEEHAIEGSI